MAGNGKHRTARTLFLATALILLSAMVVSQPSPPQNIYGNVTYETGEIFSGANVSVVDESGNVAGYGLTDSEGYYDFNFDGGGTYYVFVGDWNSSKTIEYTSGGSEKVNVSDYPTPGPPEVSTKPASNIGMESATLEGAVNYNSLDTSVDVRFQYNYSNGSFQESTSWMTLNYPDGSFSTDWTGLEPDTSYDYRAQMKYNEELSNGSTTSFKTDANTTDQETDDGDTEENDTTDDTSDTSLGGFTGGGSTDTTEEDPGTRYVNVSLDEDRFSRSIGDLEEGQDVIIEIEAAEVTERIEFTMLEARNDTGIEYRYRGLNRPEGVQEPTPLVYSYEAISFTGLDSSDFVDASVDFSVSKEWFDRSGAETDTVNLRRYDDGWKSYSTELVSEDGSEYRFTTRTPGFSYFAVASGEVEKEPDISVKNLKLVGDDKAPANINATVVLENVGTSAGSETVSLMLDGEEHRSESVNVGSGDVETVQFNLELGEGDHTISVGSITRSVTVEEPEGGFPWMMLMLMVLGGSGIAYYFYSSVHSPGMEEAIDMTRVSSIEDLKRNEEMYLDEEVKLSGVKVDPIEKTEDGWRYIITDNTGKIMGLSPQKTRGRGSIGGPIKKENGELLIVF